MFFINLDCFQHRLCFGLGLTDLLIFFFTIFFIRMINYYYKLLLFK